jgi:hypothetical protein
MFFPSVTILLIYYPWRENLGSVLAGESGAYHAIQPPNFLYNSINSIKSELYGSNSKVSNSTYKVPGYTIYFRILF